MPIYRATRQLPSAKVRDGFVIVTVPIVDVGLPDGQDEVEIELTLRHAKQLSGDLRAAIEQAARNAR